MKTLNQFLKTDFFSNLCIEIRKNYWQKVTPVPPSRALPTLMTVISNSFTNLLPQFSGILGISILKCSVLTTQLSFQPPIAARSHSAVNSRQGCQCRVRQPGASASSAAPACVTGRARPAVEQLCFIETATTPTFRTPAGTLLPTNRSCSRGLQPKPKFH